MAFIGNRLVTTEGSPLKKAEWFAEYWNTRVTPRGVFGRIEPKAMPEGIRKGSMIGFVRLPPPRRSRVDEDTAKVTIARPGMVIGS